MIGLVAALRIKNEARWIREVIESVLPVCQGVVVLDDHSDDHTPEICEQLPRTHVLRNAASGLDEARDKNVLTAACMELYNPQWILMIDGDEILTPASANIIRAAWPDLIEDCYSLQVYYLWDRPDQVRIDGIYGDFWRPSLFRIKGSCLRFRQTRIGVQGKANLHTSNAPTDRCDGHTRLAGTALEHWGYIDREQRIRKWRWYNQIDPGNQIEDEYRHVVQGDVPEVPSEARLKHAGPLRTRPWP